MVNDQLTHVTIQLLLREPFYAHVLTGLPRQVSAELTSTLGLGHRDDHLVLFVNPRYWKEQLTDPGQGRGALKHEVLHLFFRHPLRRNEFADSFLYDVAADLLVNQYVEPELLTADALLRTDFPGLSLPPEQATEYYYECLRSVWEGGRSPAKEKLRFIFEHREHFFAGHTAWPKKQSPLESGQLNRSLTNLVQRARARLSREETSRLPAGIRRSLLELDPAGGRRVHWRQVLRIFAQSSSRTHLKTTIRRPSRRYGTTPGLTLRRRHRLLVAVDTSGSIREAEFQEFFAEIYQIWRRGAAIRIVTCDAKVQSAWEYQGRPPAWVPGGGATRYDPVLAYANGLDRFDGLIYFTDGFGPAPQLACRLPVLWVISKEGLSPEKEAFRGLPGRKVRVLG